MVNRKAHVEFSDRIEDITEYIPCKEKYEPLKTATSSESIDRRNVFLDEIALLKKKKISRDASLKHRKMAADPKKSSLEQAPITFEELRKRGITLESGRVIHSLPSPNDSTASSVFSCSSVKNTSSNTRSSISRASTVQSRISCLKLPFPKKPKRLVYYVKML